LRADCARPRGELRADGPGATFARQECAGKHSTRRPAGNRHGNRRWIGQRAAKPKHSTGDACTGNGTLLESCRMKFLLLRLVIASLAAAVVAPPALPQPIEQSLTFPIIALDHHGRPVKNLTPDSLLILDNKTPIVSGVKLLRAADFPLRLGIVIDTSRSQSDNRLYEAGLNAAKEFVNQVLRSEQDRVFFQLFSDTSKATPYWIGIRFPGFLLTYR
jgi:hypothetical protein